MTGMRESDIAMLWLSYARTRHSSAACPRAHTDACTVGAYERVRPPVARGGAPVRIMWPRVERVRVHRAALYTASRVRQAYREIAHTRVVNGERAYIYDFHMLERVGGR